MTVGRTCCHQLATWQHFFLYLSTHSTVGYSVRFCFFGILLWVFLLTWRWRCLHRDLPNHYTPLTSLDETSSFDLLSPIWIHTCKHDAYEEQNNDRLATRIFLASMRGIELRTKKASIDSGIIEYT